MPERADGFKKLRLGARRQGVDPSGERYDAAGERFSEGVV
jgi:hypothetical protein